MDFSSYHFIHARFYTDPVLGFGFLVDSEIANVRYDE